MQDKPKTEEENLDELYPAKDYQKKTFPFSRDELEQLAPLEDATKLVNTLFTLGQIAQRAKDNFVTGQVVPRFGIKSSTDTKISYDLIKKTVLIYEPRLWCIECDNKKAEYKYQGNNYCRTCIEAKKKELEEKPASSTEVKDKTEEEVKN